LQENPYQPPYQPYQQPYTPYLHGGQGITPSDRFAIDKFQLNRKVLSLGNKYYLYNEANQPLFYIDRPSFKMKSEFGIYEDDTKARKLLSLNQESAWTLINYSFTLQDETGGVIARFRRHGWLSMLRRTWIIYDSTGREIAKAHEDSWFNAIMRRIAKESVIGIFFLTNFVIERPDGSVLGDYIRKRTLADKHVMDLTRDPGRTFDRRVAVALGVLLDNMERG
jgi:uncharacterized protein YxjI